MMCRGLGTQDAAPRRMTIDDVTKSLADLSARLDRLNEKRNGQRDRRPVIHVDFAPHAARVRAINEAHDTFWRARG